MPEPGLYRHPDWDKVEKMVGLPDYGVAFCLSPWPDGGWMAGVGITDLDWVTEQALRKPPRVDPAMLMVPELTREGEDWDLYDGFKDGIVAHGDDAADAIEVLWAKVHGEANPLRRHQRMATPPSSQATKGAHRLRGALLLLAYLVGVGVLIWAAA